MKRLLSFLLLVAAGCTSGPGQNTPPATLKVGNYSGDVGPTPVGVIPTTTLHDAQRNKDVDVSIDYPTRGGPYPIIVFSHGYGSSNHGYEPLVSYWTSDGYVCIRPSHADAGALREVARDIVTEQRREQRRGPPPQQQHQPAPRNPMEEIWDREREAQWQNRVADIKLVLDSLNELERRFPELQGKMDHSRIGVAGHSYGAFTSMLIAGMRTFGSPPLQLPDPRVRAVIAMSPQGVATNRDTTPQSWVEVHIPIMYMTGTNDRGTAENEDANWRKQAFDYSPAGDKYFLLIDGARHASFTGQVGFIEPIRASTVPQPSTSPYGQAQQPPQRGAMVIGSDRRIFQIIKVTSLAFWDAYLKSDSAARDLLQPQKYDSSFGGAHLTAK